jgi:uncharacterized protein (UPF0276 family)
VNAGIGLRAQHFADFTRTRPPVGFIEAHSENYFGLGGKPWHDLQQARRDYPLSLHGVGLSIGSADPVKEGHLQQLAELIDAIEPQWVSDHLCWASVDGEYANDLLPLPYTEATLQHVVDRTRQVQERLGRQVLLENPSSYFEFAHSSIPEWEFVAEVARRSGCGVLLDVNNVYVSAFNHGFDASRYLRAIPAAAVKEIHLAGFTHRRFDSGAQMLIDTHNAPVADAVWGLYCEALQRFGPVPTLIEWDTDLPALPELVAQAQRADDIARTAHARAA